MADASTGKPTKKTPKSARLGSTGEAVRLNIRRLRDAQGISGSELSSRLDKLDRPIPLIGIQRIESGERRVDADDLAAIAIALGVSPASLLMPSLDAALPDDTVQITGLAMQIPAAKTWDWLTAQDTLQAGEAEVLLSFLLLALPKWKREEVAERYRAASEQLRDRAIADIWSSRGSNDGES